MSINDQCIKVWACTMNYAELAVSTIVEMDEVLWFKENEISVAE